MEFIQNTKENFESNKFVIQLWGVFLLTSVPNTIEDTNTLYEHLYEHLYERFFEAEPPLPCVATSGSPLRSCGVRKGVRSCFREKSSWKVFLKVFAEVSVII